MTARVTRAERLRGAILGQFVGDALCLGSHWYYNFLDRNRIYPEGIKGFEKPVPGHYHAARVPGQLTHYGDAALVLLRSVAEKGGLDPIDYGRRFVELFGDSAYPGYLDKPTRLTFEHWRDWRAAHPEGTLERYGFQDGGDDEQNVTTSRLAPVAVRYADTPELDRMVERAVRVCQNNANAVLHAQVHARALERLFRGEPLEAALDAVIGALDGPLAGPLRQRWADARALRDRPVVEATGEFGRACYLPSAFPSALHTALRHADSLEAALLECCRAGGDNASRSAVVGAWLGALHGAAAIPEAWLARLEARAEIERLTDRIVRRVSG